MENPLSWTPTQRILNQVSHFIKPGKSVVEILKTASVLTAPDHLHDQIADMIDEMSVHHQELLDTGFCGQSLPTQIYHKLLELGHISG